MVCLLEQPINIVNQHDVSLVVKIDFTNLGVGICGGAIGNDGFKMCVKLLSQCTIQKHRKTAAVSVPKHISSLSIYVLITISS